MMNNANQISKETVLWGYIGENAGVSRFSASLNKRFREAGDDAMMIPMNIRSDDLYFTVSNMKKSQVSGAVISSEYVNDVVELLDESSSLVKGSNMCDIIFVDAQQKLRGDIFSLRALGEYLKDMMVQNIALLGVNHYAKAFAYLSCGFNVSYFNENLEELMEFTTKLELGEVNLNRIASGMDIDFSTYDAVLDFSDIKDFSMVKKFARVNLDMKHSKEISHLKESCENLGYVYRSYDDMIEEMTFHVHRTIKRNKK